MGHLVTEVYEAFRLAGVDDAAAKAAAAAIPLGSDLATTADVNRIEAELVRVEADLKADLKVLKFGYGPAILGLLIKLAFFP